MEHKFKIGDRVYNTCGSSIVGVVDGLGETYFTLKGKNISFVYTCFELCRDAYPVIANDPINSPKHYTSHPSGVECIDVTEHMNFCLGNAMKYLWRAGIKTSSPIEDLQKSKWYIEREIARLEKAKVK